MITPRLPVFSMCYSCERLVFGCSHEAVNPSSRAYQESLHANDSINSHTQYYRGKHLEFPTKSRSSLSFMGRVHMEADFNQELNYNTLPLSTRDNLRLHVHLRDGNAFYRCEPSYNLCHKARDFRFLSSAMYDTEA